MIGNNDILELSLLGALISYGDDNINEKVFDKLKSEDFKTKTNREIFDCLKNMQEDVDFKRYEINLIIKDLERKNKNIGNILAVAIENSIFPSNVEKVVDNIKKTSVLEQERKLFKETFLKFNKEEMNSLEALNHLEIGIDNISNIEEKDLKKVEKVVEETLGNIQKRVDGEIPEGQKTPFEELNKITNGFQNGTLNIIAARPAMGKTAFAINLATHISKEKNVAFFSLEMPPQQLMERAISSESQVQSFKLKNGNIDADEQKIIKDVGNDLKKRNLLFNTSYSIPFDELIYIIKKENRKKKLDLIMIDYLQLIEPSLNTRGNREQEVAKISRTLKSLSLELNVPIIALSQLSRGVEHRENKRPMMSDLRESGAIEQDADLIMFLYRDDYYNNKENDESKISEVEIIISKHRQGSTGTIKLDFDLEIGKFESLANLNKIKDDKKTKK